MLRSTLPVVALAALLVLAGCSLPGGNGATPTPAGTPAGTPPSDVSPPYFVFQNDVGETREITMYLTEGRPTEFRVTFENGTTVTVNQSNVPWNADRIVPATAVLASETYSIEPRSNLFVALRGCAADTYLWFFHLGPRRTDLSYGPSYECPGSTILEFRNPNGGGSAVGGDYRDVLDDPSTTYRVLAANGTQS